MAKGWEILKNLGLVIVNLYAITGGPMSYDEAYSKLQQLQRRGEVSEEYYIDERNYTQN